MLSRLLFVAGVLVIGNVVVREAKAQPRDDSCYMINNGHAPCQCDDGPIEECAYDVECQDLYPFHICPQT